MKCPYCGAEVKGWRCEYCDSILKKTEVKWSAGEWNDIEIQLRQEIAGLCENFLKDNFTAASFGRSYYDEESGQRISLYTKFNDRLYETLEIPDTADVYLIHDDTLRLNGKNGFAIASDGFHCKEFMENCVHISYEEFARARAITYHDNVVWADNFPLAYYTGDKKCLLRVEKLIQQIHDYLK